MPGHFRAVALDLDGTLAVGGAVSSQVLRALDDLRSSGVAVLLVTGRIEGELEASFPGLAACFDAVVTENGAVVQVGRQVRLMGPPVARELEQALERRGVRLRRGRCLLACDGDVAHLALQEITRLGLDHQLVHNRSALMVLPSGITKAVGLIEALRQLAVSPHSCLAVGDAENDLSLLHAAEVGVAAPGAVASLRTQADAVLPGFLGADLAALLGGPLLRGVTRFCPPRRWVVAGEDDAGAPVHVPGSQANVLITGSSRSGKSYLAGLLFERWSDAGYVVMLLDPEGDHVELGGLPGVVVVDGRAPAASMAEALAVLGQQVSVVLDLSGLDGQRRSATLRQVHQALEAHRASRGVPHWLVVDEAHSIMGEDVQEHWSAVARGLCLATYRPELLPPELLADVDMTLTTVLPVGTVDLVGPDRHVRAVLQRGTAQTPFAVAGRRSAHVRHRRKYADVELPPQRWFHFRTAEGEIGAAAHNLTDFVRYLRSCPPGAVDHHALRGDFSRWAVGAVQDSALGAELAAAEREVADRRLATAQDARRRMVAAVEHRYGDEGDS